LVDDGGEADYCLISQESQPEPEVHMKDEVFVSKKRTATKRSLGESEKEKEVPTQKRPRKPNPPPAAAVPQIESSK
jgi:hypothetical protein